MHKQYWFTIYLVPREADIIFKAVYDRAEAEEDLEKVPLKLFSELEINSKFMPQKCNSKSQVPMRLTEEEKLKKESQSAETCHICEK